MRQAESKIDFGGMKTLYSLNNAIVTPTVVNRKTKTFSGCIYDQTGCLIKSSQRTQRNVGWKPENLNCIDPIDVTNKISGRCLYLGHYTAHYGHFILETLSRFWVLQRKVAYDKLIFHPFIHSTSDPESFSPMKICLECFCLESERVLIVDKTLRFTNLSVPTALVEINNEAQEEQSQVYKQIGEYCENVYDQQRRFLPSILRSIVDYSKKRLKLYLSRKYWKKNFSIANESEVEKVFSSFGFTIIYPERLSFEKQVVLYKNAEVIAGFEGSGMHNSVFMKTGALAITIGSYRRPNKANRNQEICDWLSKVQSIFIKFESKGGNDKQFDPNYLRSRLNSLLA
ncbi:MAG: DUF563 domain-containing protein [Crocosphaera sp.]